MVLLPQKDMPGFIGQLKSDLYPETLHGLPEDQQSSVNEWIQSRIDPFLEKCMIIDDEQDYVMIWMLFYIQMKTEWSQLNTHIQYSQMNGKEVDFGQIYLASLISVTIREFERFLNLIDVEYITTFLSAPSVSGRKRKTVEVDAHQHSLLVNNAIQLQSEQSQHYNRMNELLTDMSDNSSDQTGNHGLVRSLKSILTNQQQLSNVSIKLRKGINELRQTEADKLFKRLEQFWHNVIYADQISGTFSVIGSNVAIDKVSSDLLLDPLSLLIRQIVNCMKDSDSRVDLTLHVRYSGSELLVSLDGAYSEPDVIKSLEKAVYDKDFYYSHALQLLDKLNSDLETQNNDSDTFSFLIRLKNMDNVTLDCLVFKAAGMSLSISRDSVHQIVRTEDRAVRYTDLNPVYNHAGKLYPYLSVGDVIEEKCDTNSVLLIKHNEVEIALGIEEIEGFDIITLQSIDTYTLKNSSIRNIGVTVLGKLTGFIELEELIHNQNIHKKNKYYARNSKTRVNGASAH